jgi:hypothetical protein
MLRVNLHVVPPRAMQVMKEMYKLRSQPVVYLAHPVHVEDPKDRWVGEAGGVGEWGALTCCPTCV